MRKVYNQKNMSLTIDGVNIQDFHEGATFVYTWDGGEVDKTQGTDGAGINIATNQGATLQFTLRETSRSIKFLSDLRLRQERSYLLALTGAPPLPGMWLDAGEEGWSLRRSGRYLLLGGGGHRCGENLGDSYDRLRAQAQRLFPAAQEAFAWSSQDCMTLDGVPYIGPYSSSAPFLHVATGFGKWGMTGSMVAATLLTARLTGEDYPYADIFSPQRFFPSASISAFWEGAGYAVRGIGRRLFVPAQTAAADIARGHGGIVAWQGKKYGVYRHTDGTLFAVDIRCPHRGCELTWNDDEKSWDCPCHGSRFDYTGRRLSEPAKAALKPCEDFPQEI